MIVVSFCLPLIGVACGGDDGGDEEPYDTLQACFDDHHDVEAFSVIDSIKICCIDHPIGANAPDVVCGETAQACEDFLDVELTTDSATLPEIQQACDEYLVERGQ